MSEFSYIIFRINTVSKRLSLLDVGSPQCSLIKQEIESLSKFRMSLIERAIAIMINVPFVQLATSFFRDNRELHRDKTLRYENEATFSQILKQATKAVMAR